MTEMNSEDAANILGGTLAIMEAFGFVIAKGYPTNQGGALAVILATYLWTGHMFGYYFIGPTGNRRITMAVIHIAIIHVWPLFAVGYAISKIPSAVYWIYTKQPPRKIIQLLRYIFEPVE